MAFFDEDQLEQAIIQLFLENDGYLYTNGEEQERNTKDIILKDDLISFLSNRYYDLSEGELSSIIANIENRPSSPLYKCNKEIFDLINKGYDFPREDIEKNPIHVNYIDFDNPENNIFRIVNQYTVEDVKTRRPDMILFINGIPAGIFEFKSAIKEDTTIYDAWKQIHIRYSRDIPALMKYCAFAVISDGANTKIGTIFSDYEYFYGWNKVNDNDNEAYGINSLISMIKGAFTRKRIVKILQDFVFYPDKSNSDTAIICRYPQYFGAVKMLDSIRKHMLPLGDGKGGTYFGATGCGKTYTMLFLSRMLTKRYTSFFNNPTTVIITDREDLDNQTSEIFVNAKNFLGEENVRSIESRKDLKETLGNIKSGGIYIIAIQKFCEDIGLLSDRQNIICISDEAHRTQGNLNGKEILIDEEVKKTYGFAKYLRDSFPNATYAGFTGTPLDETFTIFGPLVEQYTMEDACRDGITVRLNYEPRISKILLDEDVAKAIDDYYKYCSEDLGSNPEQVEKSKRYESKMRSLLGHPERVEKIAADIIAHYEKLLAEKPSVVQKAMIVGYDRPTAFKLYNEILKQKPEWGEEKLSERDNLTEEEKSYLKPISKIKLVATRSKDDPKDLYDTCGDKKYRKELEKQFKNNNSNFSVAVVVDMWITGFDVPSLAVMYIDKPLKKHTLIQTISRVNRVFKGKEQGLIVDYVGFEKEMLEAVKMYGTHDTPPVTPMEDTVSVFRNELDIVKGLLYGFDYSGYFTGSPTKKLSVLNHASEFIQTECKKQTEFLGHTKRLKSAYAICNMSGELTDDEINLALFIFSVRAVIVKTAIGTAPDAETMNRHVEEMMKKAISCTKVENIFDEGSYAIFDSTFLEKIKDIKMPATKFNALVKLLKKTIKDYSRINGIKAKEFSERLKKIIEEYNKRDTYTPEDYNDLINDLSDKIIAVCNDLEKDKNSFEALGISQIEKAFYDILVKTRDEHGFEYEDGKCIELAKKIYEMVSDFSQFANFATKADAKSKMAVKLIEILYEFNYPPEWKEEVFEKVLEQTVNYKNNN